SPINDSNAANTQITGTAEALASISVIVSDGTNSTTEYTTTVNSSGAWSISGIDVSSLADGQITYTVKVTSLSGLTAETTEVTTKDTTAPTVEITDVTDPISAAGDEDVTIEGEAEAGATIVVTATDGTNTTPARSVTANANGEWSIADLDVSDLDDGEIAFSVTATDAVGNTSAAATITANKDTV